jgi:RNA polymerase sigma-32 factor
MRKKKPSKVHTPEVLPAEEPADAEVDSEAEADADAEAEAAAATGGGSDDSGDDSDSKLPVAYEAPEELGAAISPNDPLRRYLDEVRRVPMLDLEEELALVRKMREEGDVNAAKRLVSANLRLVVKIALEYRSFYTNLLDLIQEGNVGLMKAVSKFDPTKGARLGYYASWWIRSYILKYMLDNFRLVKVGTTQAQKKLFYHLMREKERLEAQGLLAGPKLLAEKLNVREKDVVEMEQRLSSRGAEMSLDAPIGADDESSASHIDFLADDHEGADDRLARDQMLRMLRERLPEFQSLLNEKEQRILRERLLSEEPKTLQEVADQYGLTRERARQIEAKVIAKLRDFLTELR